MSRLNIKRKNNKLLAALSAAILAMSLSSPVEANVQDKMNAIFGSMTSVSRPAAFKSARRGVLSGGSIMMREPVVDSSLINIQLPRASGGCGGIDIFAGSVSFINADQFIALLRAIAANAKGFAFELAMKFVSPDIANTINTLQKLAQMINNMNLNSCQLAEGIVNVAADAMGQERVGSGYAFGCNWAGMGDVSECFNHTGNTSNVFTEMWNKAQGNANVKSKLDNFAGNLVWKALKKTNGNSLLGSGTDNELFGQIMGITGTILIPPPEANQTTPQTGDIKIIPKPSVLEAHTLINGGTMKYYSCNDAADCMDMVITEKSNEKGLYEKFYTVLNSVIDKFQAHTDNFTNEEKNFMTSLPPTGTLIITNLANQAPETARAMSSEIAFALAMHWAYDMTRDYIRLVKTVASTSKMEGKQEFLKDLDQKMTVLNTEYLAYSKTHKPLVDILKDYNAVQANIVKQTASIIDAVQKKARGGSIYSQ